MKIEKNELIESIKNLNKKKPLKEQKEIQRVLPPADADAQEQHQQALEQNAKRRDPKNYEKEVKELIEETASEDSRYRHFDVVDRKDLAKRINEAKEKGLDFKVSKSKKDGFKYELTVLKEEFIKKEAGDPEVNVQAFNNATNVGASSPTTGLGEDMEEEPIEQCSICNSIKFLIDDEKEAIDGYKKADECLESLDDEELKVKISSLYNHIIGEELEHIRELQEMLAEVDPNCSKELPIELHERLTDDVYNYEDDGSPRPRVSGEQLAYDLVSWISDHEGDVLEDVIDYLDRLGYDERVINGLFFRGDALIENIESSKADEDDLDEELKIYTSSLSNFHPSERAKDLWDEIKENHKEEDLEYMLETLYPDGISDVALDDLLCYEEDWIRDLIDLPLEDEETEDSIPDEDETLDDLDDEDIEPLDIESDIESEDDIEPIEYDEEDEVEEPKIDNDSKKDKSKEDESKKDESKESDEDIEKDDEDKVNDIAEGFIKKNFKPNTLNEDTTVEETMKKAVCESSDDDEEIVEVNDEVVEGMMGLPTSKKDK